MFKNFTIGIALLAISADAQRRPRGRLQTMGGIAEIEDDLRVEESRVFAYLYQRKDRDGDIRPARLEGYALGLEPGVRYTISIQDNPGDGMCPIDYEKDRQVLEFPILSEQEEDEDEEDNSGQVEDDDDEEDEDEDDDDDVDDEDEEDEDDEDEEDEDEEDEDEEDDDEEDDDEADEDRERRFLQDDEDDEEDEDNEEDEDDEEDFDEDDEEDEDGDEDEEDEEDEDEEDDDEEDDDEEDDEEEDDDEEDEEDEDDDEEDNEEDDEEDNGEMQEAIKVLATLDDQFNLWEGDGETLEGKMVVLAREGLVVGCGEVIMLDEGYTLMDVQEEVQCWNFPELC